MFAEVKSMLPVSGSGYDRDIIIQIKAAVADLTKTERTDAVCSLCFLFTYDPISCLRAHHSGILGSQQIAKLMQMRH